jgi:hypothetical protein
MSVSNCLQPVSCDKSETRLICLQLSPLPLGEETEETTQTGDKG